MKKSHKIIIFSITTVMLGSFLFFSFPAAQAQTGISQKGCELVENDKNIKPIKINFFLPRVSKKEGSQYLVKNIQCFTIGIYVYFAGAVGILATVMIMYGGIKYLTSYGNQTRISEAKDTIFSSLVGIILTLGSFVILNFINPNLIYFTKEIALTPIEGTAKEEKEQSSLKGGPAVGWEGGNVSSYDLFFMDAQLRTGIDAESLKAIMLVESSGIADASSPAGACGLMQLLPSTAQETIEKDLNSDKLLVGSIIGKVTCDYLKSNPSQNILIAAVHIRNLLSNPCPKKALYRSGQPVSCVPKDEEHQTQCAAGVFDPWVIAAYNGGSGANCTSITCPGQTWWECEQNPGFSETRNYVVKVRDALEKIKKNNWLITSAP